MLNYEKSKYCIRCFNFFKAVACYVLFKYQGTPPNNLNKITWVLKNYKREFINSDNN